MERKWIESKMQVFLIIVCAIFAFLLWSGEVKLRDKDNVYY
jgi:hypothetical protein